jgi:hypothetical protein
MPPHAETNNVLPDPTPFGLIRRSLVPTPSKNLPHNAGDTSPNDTLWPGPTAKLDANGQTQRGDHNPETKGQRIHLLPAAP